MQPIVRPEHTPAKQARKKAIPPYKQNQNEPNYISFSFFEPPTEPLKFDALIVYEIPTRRSTKRSGFTLIIIIQILYLALDILNICKYISQSSIYIIIDSFIHFIGAINPMQKLATTQDTNKQKQYQVIIPEEIRNIGKLYGAVYLEFGETQCLTLYNKKFLYFLEIVNGRVSKYSSFSIPNINCVIGIIKGYFLVTTQNQQLRLLQVKKIDKQPKVQGAQTDDKKPQQKTDKILSVDSYFKQLFYTSYFLRQVTPNMIQLLITCPAQGCTKIFVYQFTINQKLGGMGFTVDRNMKILKQSRQQLYASKVFFYPHENTIIRFKNFSDTSFTFKKIQQQYQYIIPLCKTEQFYCLNKNYDIFNTETPNQKRSIKQPLSGYFYEGGLSHMHFLLLPHVDNKLGLFCVQQNGKIKFLGTQSKSYRWRICHNGRLVGISEDNKNIKVTKELYFKNIVLTRPQNKQNQMLSVENMPLDRQNPPEKQIKKEEVIQKSKIADKNQTAIKKQEKVQKTVISGEKDDNKKQKKKNKNQPQTNIVVNKQPQQPQQSKIKNTFKPMKVLSRKDLGKESKEQKVDTPKSDQKIQNKQQKQIKQEKQFKKQNQENDLTRVQNNKNSDKIEQKSLEGQKQKQAQEIKQKQILNVQQKQGSNIQDKEKLKGQNKQDENLKKKQKNLNEKSAQGHNTIKNEVINQAQSKQQKKITIIKEKQIQKQKQQPKSSVLKQQKKQQTKNNIKSQSQPIVTKQNIQKIVLPKVSYEQVFSQKQAPKKIGSPIFTKSKQIKQNQQHNEKQHQNPQSHPNPFRKKSQSLQVQDDGKTIKIIQHKQNQIQKQHPKQKLAKKQVQTVKRQDVCCPSMQQTHKSYTNFNQKISQLQNSTNQIQKSFQKMTETIQTQIRQTLEKNKKQLIQSIEIKVPKNINTSSQLSINEYFAKKLTGKVNEYFKSTMTESKKIYDNTLKFYVDKKKQSITSLQNHFQQQEHLVNQIRLMTADMLTCVQNTISSGQQNHAILLNQWQKLTKGLNSRLDANLHSLQNHTHDRSAQQRQHILDSLAEIKDMINNRNAKKQNEPQEAIVLQQQQKKKTKKKQKLHTKVNEKQQKQQKFKQKKKKPKFQKSPNIPIYYPQNPYSQYYQY